MRWNFGILLFLAFLISGCGSDEKVLPAEKLIENANKFFEKKEYKKADKLFRQFELLYPGDSKVSETIYKRGLALYFAKKLAEAAAVFEIFVDQYPENEKVIDAKRRIFFCFYSQINRNDRDQSIFDKALESGENYSLLKVEDPEFDKCYNYLKTLRLGNLLGRMHNSLKNKPIIWSQVLWAASNIIKDFANYKDSAEAFYRWIEFLSQQNPTIAKDALIIKESMKIYHEKSVWYTRALALTEKIPV